MKKNLLTIKLMSLFMVLLANANIHGQSFIIGNMIGVTSVNAPIQCNYKRSYTQSIYLASELSGAANKKINKIAYRFQTSNLDHSLNDYVSIYIGATDKSVFSSTSDWVNISTLSKYYEGYITTTRTNDTVWAEVTLDRPVVYDGLKNLVIAVEMNTLRTNWGSNKYSTAAKFFGTSGMGNRTLYKGVDTEPTPISITSPPVGSFSTILPNVKITYSDIQAGSEIYLPKTSLDFSYVEAGKSVTKSIPVSNYGLSDLIVSGVIGIGAPFSLLDESVTIPSMQSKDVRFSYSPTAVGASTQDVTFIHNGSGSATVTLLGNSYAAGSLFESFEDIVPPNYWRAKNNLWTKSTDAYLGVGAASIDATADTLITPKVNGNFSLFVKQKTTGATFKILTSTDLINWADVTPQVTLSTAYQQVTLNLPSTTFVGIVGSNISVDLAQSEQAIYPVKDLLITSWTQPTGLKQNTLVNFPVTVKNWGTSAESTYKVYLKNAADNSVLATKNVTNSLSPLSETVVNVEWNPQPNVTAIYAEVELSGDEDFTNDKSKVASISVTPYIGVLKVSTSKVDFGLLKTAGSTKTIDYVIKNTGIAQLNITSVTLNAPFSTNLPPFDLDPGDSLEVNITFAPQLAGLYNDTLVIAHNGTGNITKVPVSGELYRVGDLYEDFSGTAFPPFMWATRGSGWSLKTGSIAYDSNSCAYLNSASKVDTLITPQLNVVAGEKVSFYARNWTSSTDVLLKVLISSDLINWTPLFEASQANGNKLPDAFQYYSVTLPSTGKYYVGFAALKEVLLDVVRGPQVIYPDHDLTAKSLTGPAEAKVNKESTYTVTLKNQGTQTETNYSVKLMNGNDVIAEQNGVSIAQLEEKTLTLSWTPHVAGTYSISAVVAAGIDENLTNNHTSSLSVKVSVENELIKQVGTIGGTITSDVPLYRNWRYSTSETLYFADELGLDPGVKITSVGYSYYNTVGDMSIPIRVWIGNSSSADVKTLVNPSDLTLVYESSSYTFAKAGSNTVPSTAWFDLTTPIEYAGQNLIVVIEGNRLANSDYFNNIYFFSNTSTHSDRCRYYKSDGTAGIDAGSNFIAAFASATASSSTVSGGSYPTSYFKAEVKGLKVSGILKDKVTSAPVQDAVVTLTSDNLLYQSVSGENGNFNLDVYSLGKTYTLNIKKDGYEDYVATGIELTSSDINLSEIQFEPKSNVSINESNLSNISVYPNPVESTLHIRGDYKGEVTITNLSGKVLYKGNDVNEISVAGLSAGVYILKINSQKDSYTTKIIKK